MHLREDMESLSQPLAHRLAAMVDAGLLTYREYMPWADSLILTMEHAPKWVLDLAVTAYRSDALRILMSFASSETFATVSGDAWVDEYVAAVYLRYERRELSWASTLQIFGSVTDPYGGRHPCEYFYGMLNEYEESYFSLAIEVKQRTAIASEYDETIRSVRATFDAIGAFRRVR